MCYTSRRRTMPQGKYVALRYNASRRRRDAPGRGSHGRGSSPRRSSVVDPRSAQRRDAPGARARVVRARVLAQGQLGMSWLVAVGVPVAAQGSNCPGKAQPGAGPCRGAARRRRGSPETRRRRGPETHVVAATPTGLLALMGRGERAFAAASTSSSSSLGSTSRIPEDTLW